MSRFCMKCMEQIPDSAKTCPHCGFEQGAEKWNAMHIEPGEVLHERYIVGCAIGFGGFGVTYIGWDALLEHKVAIKEYMPSEFSTRSPGTKEVTVFGGKKAEQFSGGKVKFHEEAKKLARFNNDDGVVRIYDTFEENNTAYIIMELLEGETLDALLKREKKLSFEQAAGIILPIAKALTAIHKEGVIHRDIAPDNIFLTSDGKVKLIDFGAARFATTSHSRSLSVLIKQGYSPEEQYRSRGDQGTYTDVYALGSVMYHMVTGAVPPDALERRAFFENKKKDILPPITKYTKDIPQDRQNAILNAMNVRIEDRTQTTEDFIRELTTDEPVRRRSGKIKALDFFSWPKWAKIGLPAAAAFIVIFTVLLLNGVIFPDLLQRRIFVPEGMARVPSIVNTSLSEAAKRIEAENLQYKITGKKLSAQVPENLIMLQNVNGGAVVLENTVIMLNISAGAGESERTDVMPDLVYMSRAEATGLLCTFSVPLDVKVQFEESENVEEGLIIRQDVPPGTALSEVSSVCITVSSGEPAFAMPDIAGMDEQAAKELLGSKGLSYTLAYEYGTAPVGSVLSQDIAADQSVYRGDVVKIVICSGEELFPVPDVSGMTAKEAGRAVTAQGFTLKTNEAYSEDVPKGQVISQVPAADSSQVKDSVVLLTVSKGREPIKIPDTAGAPKSAAISTLSAAGFLTEIVTEYDEEIPAQTVITQSPEKGTGYRGDTINLVISKGPQPRKVPNTAGQTQAEAEEAVAALDLVPEVKTAYDENAAAGTVLSQSPASGTVPKGGTVTLTVSKGPKPRTVPNVVGKTEAAASTAITDLGLKVSVTKKYDASVKAGVVISQNPASGTLEKGGTITLTVSLGKEPIPVTAVTLNRTSKMLNTEGSSRTFRLTAAVTPTNADDTSITWSTSNAAVATVDQSGNIQAVKDGSCTITAKANGGQVSASCTVTVKTAYDTVYGEWSAWSETSVSKTDLRDVETKQQTEYGEYGSWSNWSDSSVSGSDTRQVDTKNDTRSRVVSYNLVSYLTQGADSPHYRHYREFSIADNLSAYGARSSYGEHSHSGSATVEEIKNARTIEPGGYFDGEYNGYISGNATAYVLGNDIPWFIASENREEYTVKQYRYRDRKKTVKTLYRYRNNTLVPKVYD